jgi:mannose-6-phosphate isomerase-like protein (cupin superfamily)
MELQQTDEYQPLLKGKPATHGMRSGRVYLKPGDCCGEHSTQAHEEQLVFLSGQGEALCGPERKMIVVGQGTILYIPPHTEHNIVNSGSEPLVYIYCVSPIVET